MLSVGPTYVHWLGTNDRIFEATTYPFAILRCAGGVDKVKTEMDSLYDEMAHVLAKAKKAGKHIPQELLESINSLRSVFSRFLHASCKWLWLIGSLLMRC